MFQLVILIEPNFYHNRESRLKPYNLGSYPVATPKIQQTINHTVITTNSQANLYPLNTQCQRSQAAPWNFASFFFFFFSRKKNRKNYFPRLLLRSRFVFNSASCLI